MEDIIKDVKRFEMFKKSLLDSVSSNLNTMIGLWEEMGVRNEEDRMETVSGYIEKCFSRMIREEKGHIKSLEQEIEGLVKTREGLLKELQISEANTFDSDEELAKKPLIDIIDALRDRVQELGERKEELMKEIRILIDEDEDASRWVGSQPLDVPKETVLGPSQQDQLKRHRDEMKGVRRRRLAQLEEMKVAVENLCSLLDTEPSNSLERKMVCGESNQVILSEQNMEAVEQLVSRLQNHYDSNSKLLKQFKSRIEVLCQRLELGQQDRHQYLPMSDRCTDEAVKTVRDNMEQLEEMKRQHMEKFIQSSKDELVKMWDKMYFGQLKKESFTPFLSEDFSEQVLEEMDKELERLKKYYEENRAMFDKVDEWHEVWQQSLDLEQRAKDPNRLFNSRKNNLLQEEKERKAVQRKLPKVEKELQTLVKDYDTANPQDPLMLKGILFSDYITSQKTEHGLEVVKEKATRMELRKRMLKHETMYGVKALTPINRTSAMLAKSRRDITQSVPSKRAQTNTLPSAKRRRLENDSIITGNLTKNTMDTVDSTGLYKMPLFQNDNVISSTFREEPGSSVHREARQHRGLRTPSTKTPQHLLTPNKTSAFKTPRSGLRVPTSSKTLPHTNAYGTRTANLKKMPFKL